MMITTLEIGRPASVEEIFELLVCPMQVCLRFFARVGGIAGMTDFGLPSPEESACASVWSLASIKKEGRRTRRYSATPKLYTFLLFPARQYGVADL
jgi:hypothetical protein